MKKVKQLYRYTNTILMDAYNRAAIEVYMLSQKEGYKSFAVCGSDAQVGTTSVAINLAIALSMAGWKTLLIDADMYKRNKRLSEDSENGLAECLEGNKTLQDVICETEYEALDYLPGGRTNNSISLMCSNRLSDLINSVNAQYDYVIWDLASVHEAADTKVACVKTDATILVASQYSSKDLLKEAKDIIEKAGGNVVGVIGNKLEQAEYREYRRMRRKKNAFTKAKREEA